MIPKIIHYCWFGGSPLPELALKCIESWKKYCPDYEIKCWDETNIDINSVDYMREAYEAKAWGFVPDVARLQIIYENGGIYLDTDVEIIKPIDELLQHKAFVGTEDDRFIALGLGFGAEKENPIIKTLLDDYLNRHFKLEDGNYDKTAAPKIQTKTLLELGYVTSNKIQNYDDITIFPTEYFCPLSYYTGELNITENSYSIHHYMASWILPESRAILSVKKKLCSKGGIRKAIGNIAIFVLKAIRKVKTVGITGSIKYLFKNCFIK